MMNFAKAAPTLLLGLALAGVVAVGCGSSGGATPSAEPQASAAPEPGAKAAGGPQTPESNGATRNAEPAGSTVALPFGNEKGELVCPVMGTVMADASKAVDSEVYKGVKYYFCCAGCPEQFRADPEKFANGKAIKM